MDCDYPLSTNQEYPLDNSNEHHHHESFVDTRLEYPNATNRYSKFEHSSNAPTRENSMTNPSMCDRNNFEEDEHWNDYNFSSYNDMYYPHQSNEGHSRRNESIHDRINFKKDTYYLPTEQEYNPYLTGDMSADDADKWEASGTGHDIPQQLPHGTNSNVRRRGKRRFNCFMCSKTFSKFKQLMTHKKEHTEQSKFTCAICSKTFNRSFKLTYHLKSHKTMQLFYCKFCRKKFSDLKKKISHENNEHSGEKPSTSDVCRKDFAAKAHLNRHTCDDSTVTSNQKKLESTSENLNENGPIEPSVSSVDESNSDCSQPMKNDEKVEMQLETCNSQQTSASPRSVSGHGEELETKPSLAQRIGPKNSDIVKEIKKEYNCSQCYITFNNANQLKKHEMNHKTRIAKLFICHATPNCGMRFNNELSLLEHKASHENQN